jgi:ketosteroid isomerase-like protein
MVEVHMRTTVTVLALSASLGACGHQAAAVAHDNRSRVVAGENGENGALVAAEHAWVDAAIAGNADAFGRFMADEYVAQGPDGTLITKQAWMQKMREGKSTFQAVKFCNMVVRVNGDAAVVTADFAQVATRDGRDNSRKGSELDFWMKREGRWLVMGSAFAASSPQCST